MQITFVSPTVNMSGGTKVIALHAEGLARMGHAVRIVSPPRPPVPLRRRLRSLVMGGLRPPARPLSSHLDGRAIDHRVLERWRPVTDADVPAGDVVIATWWETAEWVNALGPDKGAKVYFIQGHEVFPNLPLARCRATYRLPLHKIVVSRWLKDIMRAKYADDTVDVVLNSVDQSQFFAPVRAKQPEPTVGLVYASGAIKGVDAALAAIEAARVQFPRLRVVCFGAERPGASLPLPAGCQFTFAPPQDLIRSLYAQCDAWISASRSDGFNLPVIEAMACRTPVVTTRTGWPAESLRSGDNGVLVDIDDVDGLRRGLEWTLSLRNEEWQGLSSRAYATATTGSWPESTRTFERALRHACERSGRGEIAGRCLSLATSTP